MGRLIEEIRREIKAENKRQEEDEKYIKDKKGIEELLIELRQRSGLSRVELLEKLDNSNLSEKDIRKWKIGLKYPELDTIYKLSEIYKVPSAEIILAKNNSYEKGIGGINKKIIRWFVYTLNVSFYVGVVLTILIYIFTFIFALWFFVTVASQVKRP